MQISKERKKTEMAATGYKHLNTAENRPHQCGCFSCAKLNMSDNVHAVLGTVCAFLLALVAIITDGAIISVIISVAIIINVIIIKSHNRTGAREVYIA
jgi:hypothetical protein